MGNSSTDNFHPTALKAVNKALITLGQDVTLEDNELSSSSAKIHGKKAAFVYEDSRLKVLRDHNWNFARREYDADGETRIDVPPKCARLIMCYGVGGDGIEYRLYGNEIRANEPISRIVYTGDIEDLDKWSPDAYRALVLRLAADLAKPITGRINERQLQEQAYAEQLGAAKLADARENNVPYNPYGDNYYVKAMRGGNGGLRVRDYRFRR